MTNDWLQNKRSRKKKRRCNALTGFKTLRMTLSQGRAGVSEAALYVQKKVRKRPADDMTFKEGRITTSRKISPEVRGRIQR